MSRLHDAGSGGLALDVTQRLGNFELAAELALPASGVTALFGASGSGKTSLLRLIAGLDSPDSGRIRLAGETLVDTRRGVFVAAHRRRLGVVFQEARLFPHYRVRGNLSYGMPRANRLPGGAASANFETVVALLGIGALLDRLPGTLSGGEARRVAIGRALLSQPRMLLLDEPLSGLDAPRKRELLRYIGELARRVDIPILFVSHVPEELTAIADHLVVLEHGRVRAQGRLEELLLRFDLTEQLGGFDAASLLEAHLADHDERYALSTLRLADGQTLTVPRVDAPLGVRLRLRVPIRDVALALTPLAHTSFRNQLAASVERIDRPDSERAGEQSAVEVGLRLGEQPLRARLTRKSLDELGLEEGMPVVALVRSVAFAERLT
ncbi:MULTISPECIES: molybdenum ABC transporter ATP-binding protein [Halomonadaceae]|uniref:Molybdenum ABC transporter ATP-binding protein ModC n=1 Tax=Modicisalibacter zincidurans TaxID=1178777 RepID=A0ABP9RMG6_9GAMM|nr:MULTISPECIES: molybdenum ABC transporter ATP-binding protein [Halomonas]MCD6009691.1 molybdenum ABC transporter ATP-binding protein [Halomonas sp. IOP_31]